MAVDTVMIEQAHDGFTVKCIKEKNKSEFFKCLTINLVLILIFIHLVVHEFCYILNDKSKLETKLASSEITDYSIKYCILFFN